MQSMIVFSHLRWDFVFQRPQQLLTRLANHYRVFFVEEPSHGPGPPYMEVREREPNLFQCRPHTPLDAGGFTGSQVPLMRKLLDQLVVTHDVHSPVAWFYTPMALPLLQGIDASIVVYDCMDELSAFLGAPPDLLELERDLMKAADLVFTGGPSLYRSKQSLHPDVHCFPSSVERAHFAPAISRDIDHPEQAGIASPRLGFFGVIDERFDTALIAAISDARPDWQLIMVGPIVKIDPASLPQRPNIHYFGQRSYAELPQFLAGWDVALMPFAINEATRYISPTKVLEYMAAEKPIVSTPIADVSEPYGHVARIAGTAEAFVHACERSLGQNAVERARRATVMRQIVNATSWDSTAEKMHGLIERARARPAGWRGRTHVIQSTQPARTVIIGAGPTGLSAAYHLGEQSVLLEAGDEVGGWCRSIVDNGFTFDYAGHIMFSNDPYVHELYAKLLGDNVHWQDREAWIYSHGGYTRYPFQGALFGLPHEILKDCLIGAIEARMGPLAGHASNSAAAPDSAPTACKPDSITDCCADGITASTAKLVDLPPDQPGRPQEFRNFEEFIYGVWGWGVAKHFAIPYNQKLWTVPLSEMETSWLGGRVPLPDLEGMIEGALRPVARPQGPNARFGYPLRGGFQALMTGFLPLLRGELRLDARVTRVIPSRHLVTLADGSSYHYEKLISTMPLPKLVAMIGEEAPLRLRQAAKALRHVSVRCVNLGIARKDITEKHWIYYPEDSVFHRIFVQGNASPNNNAPGGFGLTCEITYSTHKPLPCDGDALVDLCIADCIRVGIINAQDSIVARNQVDMPYAYVVYDHARATNVQLIREWLQDNDIELAGRYSEWEYYNSDHAFLAGRKAAERVQLALEDPMEPVEANSMGTSLSRVSVAL